MINAHKHNFGDRKGAQYRPFLKSEIEAAIMNTQSMRAAAEYLRTTYVTFKKWAKLYGVWKPNTTGKYKRNRVADAVPLQAIYEGKHPHYSRTKLKDRLIRSNIFADECALCGYAERNPISGKVPLSLYQLDGNKLNMALDNLTLRCYNCLYVTSDRAKPESGTNLNTQSETDMKAQFDLSDEDLEMMQSEILSEMEQHESP